MTDAKFSELLESVERRICDKIETLHVAIFGNGRQGISAELAVLRTSLANCQGRHAASSGRRWDLWKIILACAVSVFASQLISQRAYTHQATDAAQPVRAAPNPTEPLP